MITLDNNNGDILVQGFEQGIGDSPYTGLTDMRNINTVSIPGEADVNFATKLSSNPTFTGSITSATGSTFTYTTTMGTAAGNIFQAVVFSNVAGLTGSPGISAGTVYWTFYAGVGSTFYVYTTPSGTNPVNITLTGTATFATVDMGTPRHWSYSIVTNTANVLENYIVDSNGMAWVNVNGQSGWTFLGNTLFSDSYGNGLVWYEGVNPPTDTVTMKGSITGTVLQPSSSDPSGLPPIIAYNQTSGYSSPQNLDMVSFSSPGGSLHLPAGIINSYYWVGNVVNNGTSGTFQLYQDPGLVNLLYLPYYTGSITSASNSTHLYTYTNSGGQIVTGDPVIFESVTGTSGITAGITYYAGSVTMTTFALYNDAALTSQVLPSGTGTATFSSTGTGTFTNYTSSQVDGYLFVFRGSAIDYMNVATRTWVYNWWPQNPAYTLSASPYLNTPSGIDNSHYALVGQDNGIYYCDGAFIGSILQLYPNYPFDPSNTATYSWQSQALALPTQDCATWLAELGSLLLISGVRNYVYPWDRTNYVSANGTTYTSFSTPILVAEPNITRMITVNTNTYIFAGNRGRIYITNGSQAQLWKKIPDHLSGTIEPYYTWGAIGYSQNQLYFGFQETSNTGAALPSGGLWAVDVNTQAIRVANELSYGTFNGYASVFIPNPPQGPTATPGNAFYVGWYNGTTGGMDISSSAPYVGNSASGTYAYVISDMIPVGTAIQPMTAQQFEYKLSSPLLYGESVEIQVGSSLADFANNTFTSVGITYGSGSTIILSDIFTANLQEQQWILVKCILQGIPTNTSYCRLVQLRIKGATLKLTGYFTQQ